MGTIYVKVKPHVIIQYIGVSQTMMEKQQADLDRFAHFLGEMIAKYGVEVLAEINQEKREPDDKCTTTAA